jgi:hypothetical protein
MSTPAPQVVPIFATPFCVMTLPQAQELNASLQALFATHATAQRRDARASPGALTFASRDDLVDWPEEPVRQLVAGILTGVGSVAASISDLTPQQFAALKVQARLWFTIVQPGGSVPSTSYPNTTWIAVYCVSAPEPSKTRSDSGVLRMHESRLGMMFQDPSATSTRIPYRSAHYTWRLAPGEMAVFPAAIRHEIALVRAANPLALVTARVRFVGSQQSWMPPW